MILVAREGVEPPTTSLFRAAYYQLIPAIFQQLDFAEWPQFCDHSVTSADVRLSVGPNLSHACLPAILIGRSSIRKMVHSRRHRQSWGMCTPRHIERRNPERCCQRWSPASAERCCKGNL